ncbi:MAG: hypothetical protein ABJG78_02035 [Cyclobacteriaceae bacterium]
MVLGTATLLSGIWIVIVVDNSQLTIVFLGQHLTPTILKENDLKPKWLTELQQKSWEPEVLLSGIVLYGMFKMPGLLDDFLYYFKVNFSVSTNDIDNFVGLMKVAVYWLTGGLIAHLITRGIWVGMVGLSFTFPKGITLDELKLTDKYKKYLSRIPSTEKIILNLEGFSSSLFSISFMMFMMMIGGYFYLLMTIIVPVVTLLSFYKDIFNNDIFGGILTGYLLVVLVVGFIGFIDFLTMGFFKRFKWVAKIYWPLYRVVGVLSLARFYRPIYYILLSNIKGWKIATLLTIFVVLSFQWVMGIATATYPGEGLSQISLWSDRQGVSSYTGNYDDQIDDIKSITASIQSDIIRGNTVRLFMVLRAGREDSIKAHCNLDSLFQIEGLASEAARLQCLTTFYSVAIDDSILTNLPFKFHYKSKTQQRGLLTYIDVSNLEAGLHHLSIDMPKDMYRNGRITNIPFYREETFVPYFVPDKPESADQEDESYLKLKPILPK